MKEAMPRETLQKILGAGVRAPSGENCQPWRFEVFGDAVLAINIPERDLSPYNFNQLGSMVAHGALIENIVIAASAFGYRVSVEPFPSPSDRNHTASFVFQKDGAIVKDDLFEWIPKRVSNRTPYKSAPLSAEQKGLLQTAAIKASRGGAELVLVEDFANKKMIAEAVSYGDRLLFENRSVHDFLFKHIHWTLHDAAAHKSGFYVKELGLAPPQEAVFKLLRKESILRFMNKISFPKVAAKGNVKLYAQTAALGAIVTHGNAAKDFLEVGRAFERVWLTATALGYSMQPLTAILFFMQRILGNAAQDFSTAQIEGIRKSYAVLEKEFNAPAPGRTIAMLFRIGIGKPVAHQSLRMEPEIIYQ